MSITTQKAKEIVSLGGNIEITANSGFTSSAVKAIIKIAVAKKGSVKIHPANYTAQNLKGFVETGGGSVTIVM